MIIGAWGLGRKKLPYDAEIEYIGGTAGTRTRYQINLPGGDWKGLGWYVKGSVHSGGYNWSALGTPSGKVYTNWLVMDVYGLRTGVNNGATQNKILEWYANDDGERQTAWVKQNGVIQTQNPPIDKAHEDVSPCSGLVLLGASNNNNNIPNWRLYRLTITNFGVPIYDFIPVRKGNVGYLYDRVSKRLFGNEGAGTFTLGRDIVPIEYLESTGTQYIDTNITTSQTVNFEVTAMPLTHSFWFLTAGNDYNTNTRGCFIGNGSPYRTYFRYAGKQVNTDKNGMNHINTVSYRNGIATIDGVVKSAQFSYSWDFPFRIMSPNGSKGRIYKATFGYPELLADFVPVRVDTTGYMYDKVSGVRYGNSGTGSFILGPDVEV